MPKVPHDCRACCYSKHMNEKAARIIKETIYAAVATSTKNGEPWNSPVYVVFDEALHFYWASGMESQHSRNICTNPQVFLAIYDSRVPWGTGRGVFIKAEAVEVDESDEIAKACQLRRNRIPDARHPLEDFVGDRPRRIYRATPKQIWMSQDGQVNGSFVDERVEIDMRQLQETLIEPKQ
jgi:nitroimidazol reductase NimA-like FMN-containing flavoprotein (pyridoxamine 5'-phosphate oxidase superfamily)